MISDEIDHTNGIENQEKDLTENIVAEKTAIDFGKAEEQAIETPLKDDDDEFGDFEEAVAEPSSSFSVAEKEPQTPPAAFADFRRFSSQSSFDSSLFSICDILENSSLWTFENSINDIQIEFCDILPLLDTGNVPSDIDLLDPFQKALVLWSQICYIEETLALKFSWYNSLAYNKLLESLNISQKKAFAKSKDMPIYAQHLINSQNILKPISISAGEISNSNNTTVTSTTISPQNQEIDSLSVAPVNFDWQSSGLSNPLTSAALTSNFSAIHETDFLATLESQSTSKGSRGGSILEQDLQTYGLVDEKHIEINGPSNSSISSVDKKMDLVLKNTNSTEEITTYERRKTKPISELSQEARELLLELPDYSYMLANVLMFPVVNR